MITVVGMGRKRGDLTLDGAEVIKRADVVAVRSRLSHAGETALSLRDDVVFFDDDIDAANDYDELNDRIVNKLQSFSGKKVAFCVVGDGSDDSVVQLLGDVDIIHGVGLQSAVLGGNMPPQTVIFTAQDLLASKRVLPFPTVVKGVFDKYIASEVALKLQQAFDYDNEVKIFTGNVLKTVRLDELCKQRFDGMTAIYVVPKKLEERQTFDYYGAQDIMGVLRGENGCPWDREQTHKSIVKNVIEEAYELANALENDDVPNIVEELGDLLMQILFHLEIGAENGEFEYTAAYTALCRKLIDRHPHVFGSVTASNSDESLDVWNAQKLKEHKIKTLAENVLDVPRYMSALMRSQKIQSRASKGGYDFENAEQALEKTREELTEFLAADKECKSMEGGDLLFAVVNLLRLENVDSETALLQSTEKFVNRVVECERILALRGQTLKELSSEQFDDLWAEAKKNVG